MIVLSVLTLLLLIAWSPWLSQSYSEKAVMDKFTAEWDGVMGGCGFNCNGCGITESQRALFGVQVHMEYACGMIPADSPEHHRTDTVFVSFLGTVHGLHTA